MGIAEDRSKGGNFEALFGALLESRGVQVIAAHSTKPWQKLLPAASAFDVAFVGVGGIHYLAEVKGKYPTRKGEFGFEEYRVEKILADSKQDGDPALYVIFNTDADQWLCAEFSDLVGRQTRTAKDGSYFNGAFDPSIVVFYWPVAMWSSDLNKWVPKSRLLGLADTARHLKNWEWRLVWSQRKHGGRAK